MERSIDRYMRNTIYKYIFNCAPIYRSYCFFSRLAKKKKGSIEIINNGRARIKKDIEGSNNIIRIGYNTTIHESLFKIHGDNNEIIIGDNCVFGKGCSLWCEGNGLRIKNGNRTTFTRDVHINVQEDDNYIEIGEDCMFSGGVQVRTSDSHKIFDIKTEERINEAESVSIGDHVWIAMDAKIMKGVTIGCGSIVAANAVVTSDVSRNSMVAGIPAKKIRSECKWARE